MASLIVVLGQEGKKMINHKRFSFENNTDHVSHRFVIVEVTISGTTLKPYTVHYNLFEKKCSFNNTL